MSGVCINEGLQCLGNIAWCVQAIRSAVSGRGRNTIICLHLCETRPFILDLFIDNRQNLILGRQKEANR